MDAVLISARGARGEPHWSLALAADTAAALAGAGHRVRWLCAIAADEDAPAAPDGVALTPVPGHRAPFRRVHGRIVDPRLDVALARLLRPAPADLVLHVGFGAPGSVTTLWLADRMGSRVAAVVRARELLCHRTTLRFRGRTECTEFADARRCTACCLSPTADGLRPVQAWLGRLLLALGGLSPFPNPLPFVNRLDLVLASLQLASVVVLPEPGDRDLLLAAGVSPRSLRAAATGLGGSRLLELVGGR